MSVPSVTSGGGTRNCSPADTGRITLPSCLLAHMLEFRLHIMNTITFFTRDYIEQCFVGIGLLDKSQQSKSCL